MGLLDGLNPISLIVDGIKAIGDIIDGSSTTDEERLTLKNKLITIQNDMTSKMLTYQTKVAQFQSNIIVAEAQGESWLQRNWRPIIMLLFGFVVLYATLAPLFSAPPVDMTGVPDKMWTLLTVGIGGYIGGRSVEKGIKNWTKKDAQ